MRDSLLSDALRGAFRPVAPGDTVRVEFGNATFDGAVCAVKGGYVLVDVLTSCGSVLCTVCPDAIVDVIRRAA